MPQFKTLFTIGAMLSALVLFGPFGAAGVLGGMIVVFWLTDNLLLKAFFGLMLVFSVAAPALVIAGLLYAICWVFANFSHKRLPAASDEQSSLIEFNDTNIVDAEWTEVPAAN